MKKAKIAKLKRKGWRVGSAVEFAGLSPDESAYVEIKLALALQLQKRRKSRSLTQGELASLIRSSQSRVAKMENNDPSVSMDLLVKSLLALGASPGGSGKHTYWGQVLNLKFVYLFFGFGPLAIANFKIQPVCLIRQQGRGLTSLVLKN